MHGPNAYEIRERGRMQMSVGMKKGGEKKYEFEFRIGALVACRCVYRVIAALFGKI